MFRYLQRGGEGILIRRDIFTTNCPLDENQRPDEDKGAYFVLLIKGIIKSAVTFGVILSVKGRSLTNVCSGVACLSVKPAR